MSAELNVFPCGSCDPLVVTPARTQSKSIKQWMNECFISYWIHVSAVIVSQRHRRCLGQWPESSLICMLTMDPRIKPFPLLSHWLPTIPPLDAANVLSVLNKCISLVFINVMDQTIALMCRALSLPVSYSLASLIKSALFCGKELSRKSFLTLCQVRLGFSVQLWASNGSKSSLSTDAVLQDTCLVCRSTKAISCGLRRMR